jgi:SAM dependent carboxyl methyltransferase
LIESALFSIRSLDNLDIDVSHVTFGSSFFYYEDHVRDHTSTEERPMSEQNRISQSVMESGGAYNQYARHQTAAASAAGQFLERAARNLTLDHGTAPIVIADYGSSQGKNSQAPMRSAIKSLRPRLAPTRPIFVYHVDQPSNDFNTLFEVLTGPESYTREDASLFPCVIGRSFYENVLPPGSVHIAWSSYAAVWLSQVPSPIPSDLFCSARSAPAARASFERQAAADWQTFLSLRADELRTGGCLVVALPGRDDDDNVGVESLFLKADETLAQMIDEGKLTTAERARMVVGCYVRHKRELLAPFENDGRFQNLSLEDFSMFAVPDAAWDHYGQDNDREKLARAHAAFFRATFLPSLASALDRSGDVNIVRAFGDRLENGIRRRVSTHPTPLEIRAQVVVFRKK